MRLRLAAIASPLFVALVSHAATAHAQHWTQWAGTSNGLSPGTYPVIAVAPPPARDVYYSFSLPAVANTGRVWRARIDTSTPSFTLMPGFPLPSQTSGVAYSNVNTMTTNRLGEPLVGLSAGTRSDNTDPMIMTWDETAGSWFAPTITPAGSVCAHSLYRIDRAPNGDLWAICQWHGAYHSTDDGRTFQYIDVSAALHVTHPAYFPTIASNVDTLGALYSLAFGADGTVFIGTETGGEVYSSDSGATWHPLDADATNPMSTMARASNSGDDYGTGVTLDGRVVFQGNPGLGAFPVADPTRLYTVDRVAQTVTVARGIPDYWLGGRVQFATLPTGEMFFHSNHDTVNATTGAPQLGGLLLSTNGVDWAAMNTGIDEAFMVPGMSVWVDGNGRGTAGGLALDGSDLYTATSSGRIYRYVPAGGVSPDAGVDAAVDAGVDAAVDGAVDAAMLPDVATADLVTADTTSRDGTASGQDAAVDASAPSDGSTAPDATGDAGTATPHTGCACRAGTQPSGGRRTFGAWFALLAAATAIRRRARTARPSRNE